MQSDFLDTQTISLGHGSGGLMTKELLEKIIFKTFSNPYLDQKHDGSIVDIKGEIAISTDSFVVSPIFFNGGNIGDLAVHGTVNDVAMCGAKPLYLSLAFIVEEGLQIKDFVSIVQAIKTAAQNSGVQIITGDTKVVERGKGDQIFINTTGLGRVNPKAKISIDSVKVGDKIIVNGMLAQHGMAIMSQREGLKFESNIESDTTHLNFLTQGLIDKFEDQIHLLRDPTRGGVASVLCEIAEEGEFGIELYERTIPIERQVAAACEMLGLDPLFVANEGLFLCFVDAEIAEHVVEFMKNDEKGRASACIGEVSNKHIGKVVMHSAIGGKRIVSPLIGEQLPRICWLL